MPDEQTLRATLTLAGQQADAFVHAVRGREELSRAYRYEIDFSGGGVDLEAARGERLHLTLEDHLGALRHLAGLVEEIALGVRSVRSPGAPARYRAVVVPEAFLVLSRRRGFRVLQDLAVPDIVRKIASAAGLPADDFDWSGVTSPCPRRDYCVQYDESEWDFVCRLLEDEGVHFRFDHGPDRARMVFGDDAGRGPRAQPPSLPFTAHEASATSRPEIWSFRETARATVSRTCLRDYDMLRPTLDLTGTAEAASPIRREWYEWPGGQRDPAAGKRRARIRLEELRSGGAAATARTNAIALQAGQVFDLAEHPSAAGAWLVAAIDLDVRLEEEAHDAALVRAGPRGRRLALELLPADRPFRPARSTPRPRAALQTAIVTGPAGEEIHCDEHGRVKIQLHWDRDGAMDDRSSCWVRVTQPHTTGAILIPRIGWEVLVDFTDGDPDRPVVLGRLWNPNCPPPLELPARKTETAHSSVSSPGAGGMNQVLFDDAAGAEKVSILGHRDVALCVGHDKLVSVGHDLERKIVGNRKVAVGTDETISVESNQDQSVTGNEQVTVGTRSVKVAGSATDETVGAVEVNVGGLEAIKVGNPAHAVLQFLAQQAVEAAAGAAANAANRAQAALLGPIQPVLDLARQALGAAAPTKGPAAALLGPGGGAAALFGGSAAGGAAASGAPGAGGAATGPASPLAAAAAKLDAVAGGVQAGAMAAGLVRTALGGAMAKAGLEPPPAPPKDGAAAAGARPGAGGGADAAPASADQARTGGSGVYASVVGGSVTESIGALSSIATLGGIVVAVGGNSTETVGAARVEIARKGKAENTNGSKTELVGGLYWAKAAESIAITAKNITLTFAGTQRQRIGGGHSVSAKGPLNVLAPRLKITAGGKITLTCGDSKVVLSSSGIHIEASSAIEVSGTAEAQADEGVFGT